MPNHAVRGWKIPPTGAILNLKTGEIPKITDARKNFKVMKNHFLHFDDLPRTLAAPLPLSARLSSDNASRTWSGKRGNLMEFVIRLSGADGYSVDIQNQCETRLPFPHLYLKYPGSDFHSAPFAPRRAFALLYDGSLCPRLEEAGILLSPVGWTLEITSEIRMLMEKIDILAEALFLPGNADRIDQYALCLLRELMLQHPDRRCSHPPELDSFYAEKIQRIASFLRAHYSERIDLSALAAKHGLSRRSFFRYWQRMFPGNTPHQYLLSLRLEEGQHLLGSEMPITEIARELGFSDASGFAEQFRFRYGETPTSFRRRHRRERS